MSEEESRRQPPPRQRVHPRVSRSLGDFAGRFVRSFGTPTHIFGVGATDDEVTQRHARAVIDLCLRLGEAMLATGASAADAVATVLRISRMYGVKGMHIDVTFTSIIVSIHRGLDEEPLTVLRVVKIRTTDYTRLQNVYRLIDEIVDDETHIEVDEARERLNEIMRRPRPYQRWISALGSAALASGVALMFNASFILVILAGVAALLSEALIRKLTKWDVSPFFIQMAAAAVITLVASVMFWLRFQGIDIPGSNSPTVIVISGIVMLLSGIGLTTAARDLIDGYYVTASARGLEVLVLTLGLAVGISVTLALAIRLGIPVTVGTSLGRDVTFVSGVIGSAVIGLGFALNSYVRLRLAPLFVVVAAIVYAVFAAVQPLISQPGIAHAVAGVAAGMISYLTYRWLKIPEAAMGMAGIIGLIPGLPVYRALFTMMETEYAVNKALPFMVVAVATGLGLAAGTAIGSFLMRKFFGLDRAALVASRRTSTRR